MPPLVGGRCPSLDHGQRQIAPRRRHHNTRLLVRFADNARARDGHPQVLVQLVLHPEPVSLSTPLDAVDHHEIVRLHEENGPNVGRLHALRVEPVRAAHIVEHGGRDPWVGQWGDQVVCSRAFAVRAALPDTVDRDRVLRSPVPAEAPIAVVSEGPRSRVMVHVGNQVLAVPPHPHVAHVAEAELAVLVLNRTEPHAQGHRIRCPVASHEVGSRVTRVAGAQRVRCALRRRTFHASAFNEVEIRTARQPRPATAWPSTSLRLTRPDVVDCPDLLQPAWPGDIGKIFDHLLLDLEQLRGYVPPKHPDPALDPKQLAVVAPCHLRRDLHGRPVPEDEAQGVRVVPVVALQDVRRGPVGPGLPFAELGKSGGDLQGRRPRARAVVPIVAYILRVEQVPLMLHDRRQQDRQGIGRDRLGVDAVLQHVGPALDASHGHHLRPHDRGVSDLRQSFNPQLSGSSSVAVVDLRQVPAVLHRTVPDELHQEGHQVVDVLLLARPAVGLYQLRHKGVPSQLVVEQGPVHPFGDLVPLDVLNLRPIRAQRLTPDEPPLEDVVHQVWIVFRIRARSLLSVVSGPEMRQQRLLGAPGIPGIYRRLHRRHGRQVVVQLLEQLHRRHIDRHDVFTAFGRTRVEQHGDKYPFPW